jgi:hypothetical protein
VCNGLRGFSEEEQRREVDWIRYKVVGFKKGTGDRFGQFERNINLYQPGNRYMPEDVISPSHSHGETSSKCASRYMKEEGEWTGTYEGNYQFAWGRRSRLQEKYGAQRD